MENLQDFIKPELLVVVPVLYVIGLIIKNTKKINDNYIPAIVGLIGVTLSMIYVIATSDFSLMSVFTGFTQGILCAGCAVYVNQLIKQIKKS